MKKIKTTVLGLLGATFLTAGLYSCSNDEITTADVATEQITTMSSKGTED